MKEKKGGLGVANAQIDNGQDPVKRNAKIRYMAVNVPLSP
jgi:hypothetical protein